MPKAKLKPIERYYAKYANYNFPHYRIDENGKHALATNPNTGEVLRDNVTGLQRKILEWEQFKPIRTKMSQGFLSEAVFDPNSKDPKEIERGRALRELVAEGNILTEDKKDKDENFAAWAEKKKRKDLEKRLEKAEAQVARAEELEKRIKELEAGK